MDYGTIAIYAIIALGIYIFGWVRGRDAQHQAWVDWISANAVTVKRTQAPDLYPPKDN